MAAKKTYSPAEIATMLERPMQAHEIALIVDAFYPTIRAALLEYQKINPAKVAPRRVLG